MLLFTLDWHGVRRQKMQLLNLKHYDSGMKHLIGWLVYDKENISGPLADCAIAIKYTQWKKFPFDIWGEAVPADPPNWLARVMMDDVTEEITTESNK